ncbi:hypothetical protein BBK36DRAFT_1143429 [Trichoderma citrinoviride]|uniref:Uncharacterized protein n=1 Tax=Trichoderma citrinoviride TaxID=58853 RepID=A0A2T4B313_9HYPO|nr:hypothetical protein BBK36DRAFT_1143429 [Trichoderma citrinoviride]PTB63715.1 hypothetical protein BBK36DRAFT_1143429 [Trichoderma citrinoviride]
MHSAKAPSPEEAYLYYYDGIRPGKKKLIARTSTHVWDLSVNIEQQVLEESHPAVLDKMFAPPEDDDGDVLMDQILDATTSLRIRYMTVTHTGTKDVDWQTVLLIDVEAGTLSWEDGYRIAMQCKGLMQDCGLLDVEVEIREKVEDDDGAMARLWHAVALACQDDVDNIDFWE